MTYLKFKDTIKYEDLKTISYEILSALYVDVGNSTDHIGSCIKFELYYR